MNSSSFPPKTRARPLIGWPAGSANQRSSFWQIWATIIRYYTGSIADGADWRNLRKLHFQSIIFWGAKSVKSTHASTVNSTLNFWRTLDDEYSTISPCLDFFMKIWNKFRVEFRSFFLLSKCLFLTSQHFMKIEI